MRLEQTLQMYEVGRSETFEMSVYNISSRLYELYTGGSGGIKISGNKLIITIKDLEIDELKDVHDTYKIDRYDNLYGGHTTSTSQNNQKKRISHGDD